MDKSKYDAPPTRTPDQIIEDGYANAAKRTDWRIGMAVTPKMRSHYWFRHLAVVRTIHAGTPSIKEQIEVEIYHGEGEEITRLLEPADEWMTA